MLPNYNISIVEHHTYDEPGADCYFPEQYTPLSFFSCSICCESASVMRAVRWECGHFCCDICSEKIVEYQCPTCKEEHPRARIRYAHPTNKLTLATTAKELEDCFLVNLNTIGKDKRALAISQASVQHQDASKDPVQTQISSGFMDKFSKFGFTG